MSEYLFPRVAWNPKITREVLIPAAVITWLSSNLDLCVISIFKIIKLLTQPMEIFNTVLFSKLDLFSNRQWFCIWGRLASQMSTQVSTERLEWKVIVCHLTANSFISFRHTEHVSSTQRTRDWSNEYCCARECHHTLNLPVLKATETDFIYSTWNSKGNRLGFLIISPIWLGQCLRQTVLR
jgi:hypothetical protein